MPNTEPNNKMGEHRPIRHIPNLDLLRAVAILMVLVYHTVDFLPDRPAFFTNWISKPGKYGVHLFFALSGFLIGNLFFSEHKTFGSVKKALFILRRASRTIPSYLVALAIAWGGSYVFEGEAFDWKYLCFLQNYLEEMPYFLISWSLCVEEHFYFLMPFICTMLLILLKNKKHGAVLFIFLAMLAGPMVLRLIEYKPFSSFGYMPGATHFHIDSLSAGVCMAWCYSYYKGRLSRAAGWAPAMIFMMTGLLLMTYWANDKIEFVYLTGLVGIGFAIVTALAACGRQLKTASHPFVIFIAKSSYALYLVHAVAIHLVIMIIPPDKHPDFAVWLVMMIVSLAGGGLFYLLVDKPLMSLRSRFVPRRPAPQKFNEV